MAAARVRRQVGLRPPELTYFDEIRHSVGDDPLVRVGPLVQLPSGNYRLTLHVQGRCKARALATLLVRMASPGASRVFVRVKTGTGERAVPFTAGLTPGRVAVLYRAAFRTNRLFAFATPRKIFAVTYVYPVFKARVVQFPDDNLSDYYGNYNNVAAFVFKDVLRPQVDRTPVQFSSTQQR